LSADRRDASAQFNYGVLLRGREHLLMNKSLSAYYFQLFADQKCTQFNCVVKLNKTEYILIKKSLEITLFTKPLIILPITLILFPETIGQ
jgi:hypothetical protein